MSNSSTIKKSLLEDATTVSEAGDYEAGTLGVSLVEGDLVAHQVGQTACQRQADAKAVLFGVEAYEGVG